MNMFIANNDYKLTEEDKHREEFERMQWQKDQERLHEGHKNNPPKEYEKPYEWGDEFGYIKH